MDILLHNYTVSTTEIKYDTRTVISFFFYKSALEVSASLAHFTLKLVNQTFSRILGTSFTKSMPTIHECPPNLSVFSPLKFFYHYLDTLSGVSKVRPMGQI